MSTIGAIKNITRAEEVVDATKAATLITKTGRAVDASRGFKVLGPDGVKIPFKPETSLEKAKEWTKNFYTPNSYFKTDKLDPAGDEKSVWYTMSYTKDQPAGKKQNPNRLSFEQFEDGTYRVQYSNLAVEKRGTGLGAGMYRQLFDKAKNEGAKVKSDSVMTGNSVAIWNRFKELGYPITQNPKAKPNHKGGLSVPDDAGSVFEYDPLEGAKIKKQAGPTPDGETATGMLLRKQAGEKKQAKAGIYLDDETGEYYRIDDKGGISSIEIKDGTDKSK